LPAVTQKIHTLFVADGSASKTDQWVAAVFLSFTIPLSFGFSRALYNVASSLIPVGGASEPIRLVLGIGFVLTVVTVNWLWVKTGGFGLLRFTQ
jgi:hypothetical protein